MINESFLFFVIGGVIAWLAVRQVLVAIEAKRQIEIIRRGRACEGRVVAIQHPFMLDNCTRLYFDFVPEGGERPLRGCHVARNSPQQLRAALPSAGAVVTVRYLPDRPRQAVISRLIK